MTRTIKFKRQEADKPHCMSACIAMLIGMPLSTVITEFHSGYFDDMTWSGYGGVNKYIENYIKAYGFNCFTGEVAREDGWVEGYYILSVPSLNNPASNHAIVLEVVEKDEFTKGFFVYDPQRDNSEVFHYDSFIDVTENSKARQLKLNIKTITLFMSKEEFNKGPVIDGY